MANSRRQLHLHHKDNPLKEEAIRQNFLEIERWAAYLLALSDVVRDMPFVLSGPLYLTTSPRYYPGGTGSTLTGARFSINTTSSSGSVTVAVLKNGVSIGSHSITAGNYTTGTFPVAYSTDFAPTDYAQVQVTAIGTGAQDLDCQLQFLVSE